MYPVSFSTASRSSATGGRSSAESIRARSATIVSANLRTAFWADGPSAGTRSASRMTSQMSWPVVLACDKSRAWVVSPIPRRGELTIRAKETESAGFASRLR